MWFENRLQKLVRREKGEDTVINEEGGEFSSQEEGRNGQDISAR